MAQAQKAEEKAHATLLNHCDNTIENSRVVTAYSRRILLVEELSAKVKQFNAAATRTNAARVNSEYFPQWLGKAVEFFWIVWATPATHSILRV